METLNFTKAKIYEYSKEKLKLQKNNLWHDKKVGTYQNTNLSCYLETL